MEKGKETIQKNLDIPTASSTQQPHHHSDAPLSSSSSSTDPAIVQQLKKLMQEDDDNATPPSPPSPRLPLSSIPPASHRPTYNNPHSGRPPRPQQSRRRPPTDPQTTSSPIALEAQLHPKGYLNTAQCLLHLPDERARAKYRLERQRAKKVTADWNEAGMIKIHTRPGRSPLGPGPDPYDKVIEVVSDVKEHLNQLKLAKLAAKKVSWSSSFSGPDSDSDKEPCSVEEVIRKLEKYLKGISRTVSAQEMEDKLVEFQIKVDMDPPPTWFGLMKKSTLAFWDGLTDYFVVEALEDSDLEDHILDDSDSDDDDPVDMDTDKGVGSSSGG